MWSSKLPAPIYKTVARGAEACIDVMPYARDAKVHLRLQVGTYFDVVNRKSTFTAELRAGTVTFLTVRALLIDFASCVTGVNVIGREPLPDSFDQRICSWQSALMYCTLLCNVTPRSSADGVHLGRKCSHHWGDWRAMHPRRLHSECLATQLMHKL